MPSGFDNERFRRLLRVQPWEALQTVYESYSKALLRLALYLTRNEDAAHDIVHDAFMSIWDNRKTLSKVRSQDIGYYLKRVVRNRAVSFHKQKKHADIEIVMLFRDFGLDDSQDNSMSYELYREFRAEIDNLPLRQRQSITMKIDKQMSLDAIASKLKVSRKMVEKSQLRAVRALAKWAEGKKNIF